jgi:outer membrane immunogenic protein
MKKLVLVASVLALGTVAASAADLAPRYTKAPPPPFITPLYNWSGFYGGINGGWGSSHNCWTNTAVLGIGLPAATEGCHNSSGGTAGGQIGYRWQANNWVFGLEAQGNWADFSGSNPSLLFGGLTNRTRIDAFGLFTGQVGYAWNNALFYVKGGAAVTDNRYDGLVTATGVVFDHATDTRWGGSVGAGVEVGFAPNWSAGVEYNHLFMGTQNYAFTSVVTPVGINTRNDDVRQDVDMVNVRVNYHFGGPVIARY